IAADYASDGQLLLTAGGESLLYRPGDVVAWKAADGARVADFAGHPTAVWAVDISTDGKLAATAGYDGLVKVWDVAARSAKHDLAKHKGWVRSLAFSPDGSRLATAGEDGTVVLWDTASGAEVKTVAAHAGAATCVAFAPDGGTLASGGSDKLVKLWDAATGAEKAKLEGHGDTIWAVAYAPDGGTLASCGADRSVRLWTTADGKPAAMLAGHKDWVTSLAFTADGKRLASAGLDGAIKFWDVAAKGEQEGPEKLASSVWCVKFTPDGKSLFTGTHAGPKLVAVPAPKLLPPPPPPPPPPPAPVVAVLVPTEFKSLAGANGAIAADGVVMVTGNLAKDTYTLKAAVPAGPRVTAFQIEVLPDPSLPAQGPGRAGNGNFVLTTFAVAHGQPGAAETPTPVKLAAAKATFEQSDYVVAGAIDDKAETGWGIHNGAGKPHTATFEVPADVTLPAGAPLAITVDQQYGDGTHALGRFKLSVIQAAPAPAAGG
ncbi:MAG: WD40 repeat domain-containing protein, partial [Planctomycetes bacterium]|nr:WD40 repeat domain-containing protein [Planctomycetota bacterium]